jgi:hypothetical protein
MQILGEGRIKVEAIAAGSRMKVITSSARRGHRGT